MATEIGFKDQINRRISKISFIRLEIQFTQNWLVSNISSNQA